MIAAVNAAQLRSGRSHGVVSQLSSQQLFLAVSVLLFAASAALTIRWCASMWSMGEMPMPGGWSMSMTWMRMAGQTWFGTAASFVCMWDVMMVAMMLPSLVPVLQRYRRAIGQRSETRLDGLTALVGSAYFFVWTCFGLAVFPLGVVLAGVEMQLPVLARVVPIATGVIVLIAGAFQFTPWKLHQLARCRAERDGCHTVPANNGSAWRHGLHLGIQCGYCCAGWTAILLAMGFMDVKVMTVVTAAITAERLASNGERMARALGALAVIAGMCLIVRAAV